MHERNYVAFTSLFGGLILVPENILKRKENPYVFESAGYYEKFLK